MRCATLIPQGIKSGREGGNPFFYPPVTQKLKRMSPAPLLWRPRPGVTWPGGFPLCQSGAVCGLCRASIVVGLSWIQGFAGAAAVTRSFLHVSRDLPVVRPLRFHGLTLQLPSAVRVRLRLPLRPCIPDRSPDWSGCTAPPGVAEYVITEVYHAVSYTSAHP